MNMTTIFIVVVLAVVALGLLALIGSRKTTIDPHRGQLNNDFALPVNNMGDGVQPLTELVEQQEQTDTMTNPVLSENENERNMP